MGISKLIFLSGVTLFVILPTILSSHCIITYGPVTEWCKYWTVLALAALVELAFLNKARFITWIDDGLILIQVDGLPAETLKFLFLVWLVAPLNQNGTSVIFDNIVAPSHGLVTQGCINIKYSLISGMNMSKHMDL